MSERSAHNQAPQVPVWFLLAVMAMMGLTAAGFLFLGTRLAPGAALPQEQLKLLDLVYARIQDNYVNALDQDEKQDLVHKAIGGLVRGLDRYSEYIPPERVTTFDEGNSGVYSGVGFVMQPKGDNITVYYPFPGGPAEGEGLEVGDQIVEIVTLEERDGEQVEVKTTKVKDLVDSSIQDANERERKLTQAAQKLIKGKPGTPVRLLIKRGDKTFPATITRAEVPSPSVKWARMLGTTGIGYVHLAGFVRHSATEFDTALEDLGKQAAKNGTRLRGLILDLRFNPGGVLDTCLELTNRFLRKGAIVTLNKGENNDNGKQVGEHKADPEKCTLPDLPLVILINGRSASASEVLSGALQDHGRAVIVGTRSFGKGLVQSIYPLSPEARLKITTSEYRTPNGRNIHRGKKGLEDDRWGIHPNLKVVIPRAKRDAIYTALVQHEVPPKYRAEAEALAKSLGVTIQRPLPVEEDPQLTAAMEEISKLILKQEQKQDR